ncbi:hypothetical protein CGMCC3_g15310 [Colletotrichum fructicola]|uniref:Uncharacterized protein n=1 Tax=Colletotrichum fructicola (strain Nara gc5) TaxID=1213859 RepID=A0A7J6IJK9_COLFN|nr:uncharacterized protein CGMCC3_g15310 [Colletotrichum fructicola]KAE9568549.1 hypothetical protein CGMCC3_g15310 [Colletotrichum fructicola]KAF4476560.1 hypothetical protein CGGC5_v014990 [Colletotrichum fructicola Nara gc5]
MVLHISFNVPRACIFRDQNNSWQLDRESGSVVIILRSDDRIGVNSRVYRFRDPCDVCRVRGHIIRAINKRTYPRIFDTNRIHTNQRFDIGDGCWRHVVFKCTLYHGRELRGILTCQNINPGYSCDNGLEQSLFKHSGPYFKPGAFLINLQLGRLSVIDFRISVSKLGFIVFSILCPNYIYINRDIVGYRANNDVIIAITYSFINDIFRRVCDLNLSIVFVYSYINSTFTDSVYDVNSIVCHSIDISGFIKQFGHTDVFIWLVIG